MAAQGSGNQDTDQDNLINSIDVDDDGDGVLDATERVIADWGKRHLAVPQRCALYLH